MSALQSTVEDLLFAALLSADRPNVALRLATRHYQGSIDVARLLAAPAAAGSAADGSRTGGALGAASQPSTAWASLSMGERNAPLVDHLLGRCPELEATSIDLFVEAVRRRRYAVARRLFHRLAGSGALADPRFESEVVGLLLERTELLPASVYRDAKKRAVKDGAAAAAEEAEEEPAHSLPMFAELGPTHAAHFRKSHSLWTLLLLDDANQPLVEAAAALFPRLAAATISSDALLLTMVPQKHVAALWLVGRGAPLDAAVLTALLEPGPADSHSAWQRLQLHPDCRRLVNKLMLSGNAALTSLDSRQPRPSANTRSRAGPSRCAARSHAARPPPSPPKPPPRCSLLRAEGFVRVLAAVQSS